MFKCRAAGQRIASSETTAPSMAPAPAPMTTSAADLDYLHCMSDDEREAYNEGPPTATSSASRPARIWRDGLYVPAIELAAVNPPIWQVST